MEFKKIIEDFNFEFNFNTFKNTRRRDHVEARSVVFYYLYHYRKMRLTDIVNRVYEATGWKMNHATVLHAIKNYPVYIKYNKDLEVKLLSYMDSVGGHNNRISFIQNALYKLDNNKVNEVYSIVQKAYDQVRKSRVELVK